MDKDLAIIDGLVRDHYVIEGKLFSTPFADAHKAVDRYLHSPVLLWVVKFQLTSESGDLKWFVDRLQQMQRLSARVVNVLSCGVDSAGTGFVALPPLNGFPLYSEPLDPVEGERRFAACIDIIERIHKAGVTCGDVEPGSFWINRNGQIVFIGVVGNRASWVARIDPNDFNVFRRFSAPEVIDGSQPTMASDVYSLGVLGYLLITNQYPIDEESEARGVHAVRPLQRVVENPPAWGDEILLRALEYDAGARFASASEMLNAIRDYKKESFLSSLMPVKYGIDQDGGKSGDRNDAVLITGPVMRSSGIPSMDEKLKIQEASNKKNKGILYGSIGGLIFALVCISAWMLFFHDQGQVSVDPVEQQIAAVSQNLKVRQAMAMIGADIETEDGADSKYYSELASSDDPLVADVLARSATDPKSNASRLMAEKAIIERSKRLGFLNSSEELRQWLDHLPTGEPPACYGPMLRVVDPTLPLEARAEMLRKIALSHSSAALRMTAALALDSTRPDSYEAIFRELVKSIRGESLSDKMGMPEMLFAVPETSSLYGSSVMQKLSSYDDEKLYAFLDVLVEEKDLRSDVVIKEILRRELLSPLRAFFLSSIDFQGDISSMSLSALIHAATGNLDQSDLQGLGAWFSGNSEKVLLGICADLSDSALRTSVFEILAGRSTVSEPATSLIAWLRAKKWEQRGEFAKMIGIMGVMELVPPEAYKEVYSVIDKNIKEEAFMAVLTESAPVKVLDYILKTHADHVSARQGFNLLLSDSKEIRIGAIGLLKEINDATAIKLIIDRFEIEKDPDVRKAYKENFWFIKQRQ